MSQTKPILTSLLLFGAIALTSCKESTPMGVDTPDQATSDLSTALPDLSDPADLTALPPDLIPACGFGQTYSSGSCGCDVNHPIACAGATYCCAATQACLAQPGPRGETRCALPTAAQGRALAVMAYDKLRDGRHLGSTNGDQPAAGALRLDVHLGRQCQGSVAVGRTHGPQQRQLADQ